MTQADVVVVGAGGCGLTAALAAAEQGASVLLLERDTKAGGSTALSAGLFVAAGSRLQQANGETGAPEELAENILRLNRRQSDTAVTQALCHASGPLIDWLVQHKVPLHHLPSYRYPGMTRAWLVATPGRDGRELVAPLLAAVQHHTGITLMLETAVTGLLTENGRVIGITAAAAGGEFLRSEAHAVILAAAGFGANGALVASHLPELAGTPYYGTPFATGDAISWAQQLGAATAHMGAYQTHSSIAYPGQILVTTYLINQGAIQVNREGHRFGDETDSYAGHALALRAQPGQYAIEVFDERILRSTMTNYARFAECVQAGILHRAGTLQELAKIFGLNGQNLETAVSRYNQAIKAGWDEFGRVSFGAPLAPPFYGIRVASALVQTLGGLRVDTHARVLREDGSPIPGLYAGGGTAAGFAGDRPDGYMAGMGLLAAFGLGWIAGHGAAALIESDS